MVAIFIGVTVSRWVFHNKILENNLNFQESYIPVGGGEGGGALPL